MQDSSQRRDAICSQTRINFFLSSLPGRKAFANQAFTLVCYLDLMASAIVFPHKPEPTPRPHAITLRLSVDSSHLRRFVSSAGLAFFRLPTTTSTLDRLVFNPALANAPS
jgi:hypothetical protein